MLLKEGISMYTDFEVYFASLTTGMIICYSLIAFIVWLLTIIAHWKIFTKAGKPGWASIVPLYNLYILFQIAGYNGWLFLLLLIPFVNVVMMVLVCIRLAKDFGKGYGFALGLLFLNTVFTLILGLGSSKYSEVEK